MAPSDDVKPGASPLATEGTTFDATPSKLAVPLGIGQVLGGRYEIRGVLGRGGMGEVWLARDLRLQVEVALKALLPERLADSSAIARLRAEVRSARTVSSPHVCRVYDLVEAEGLELVSMEYVDGTTLRQVLAARSPLGLTEAREIGLQLLAGLGAIHEAGLVHRDVKPENVMLTRAGRVVLMDLGIAKAVASGGTVAGTPAYWPPEQAAGAPADPRADVFAAGIVLAEMVAPAGTREPEARRAVWQAMRENPAKVPDTPWSEAIRRAVSREPSDRFPSAQALARALEEVTHRETGIEEAQPYPGLASFTEAEAEYFFGREAEVEWLWKRLPQRHLLALVGPSGAGKSSFLRAGLIPAKPVRWAHLVCTPGDAPFIALGQALASEVAGDTEAVRQIVRFDDANVAVDLFRRWRRNHGEALVVVDQLEELFTLNPAEVQARFATLLSRLALEADVHVLLAMRDDFLLRCQEHEALRPVFEGLVPLAAPAGESLHRALVQPALKCGYRFEDEALVADMLHAVEGERGALPLLAFAAASLWELRSREQGLLTRAAHDAIGGVAGALAQHAEATLDRMGSERLPLVRELFRNLVTAEGTRAVRDVVELLTVFGPEERAGAEGALRTLVDARLLTSYEAHSTEPRERSGRRVEVVHESLLTAWPRLVRWRTEDEGSAQLRDQLRQVAGLWEERGKPEDLLWTGTSYQEYQVWRARYPGGLSETEETFGRAMAEKSERFRRRRRNVFAAVLAAVVVVAAALGVLLWKSVAETAQREAGQLLALGRLKAATAPSAGLAYAVASLERADNVPARRFAVEALWQGPPMLVLQDPVGHYRVKWSPDGRFMALGAFRGVALWERDTNTRRLVTPAKEEAIGFTPDSTRLITEARNPEKGSALHHWALPEGRLVHTVETGPDKAMVLSRDFLVMGRMAEGADRPREFYRMSLDGARRERLEGWEQLQGGRSFDPTGAWLLVNENGRLTVKSADALAAPGRFIGMHEAATVRWPSTDRAVTGDKDGELRIWDLTAGRLERTLRGPCDARLLEGDPSGRYVVAGQGVASTSPALCLFDLAAPGSAEPVLLLGAEQVGAYQMRFSPDGGWIATSHDSGVTLWATAGARSLVVGRHEAPNVKVAFADDGHLLSTSDNSAGVVRRWPLDPAGHASPRELLRRPPSRMGLTLELDPAGRFALVEVNIGATPIVVPLDGSPAQVRQLTHPERAWMNSVGARLDPQGRRLATFVSTPPGTLRGIRVLDLDTGAERTLDTRPAPGQGCEKAEGWAVPVWLADGRLLSDGDAGIRTWDLAAGTSTLLRPCRGLAAAEVVLATPDSRSLVRLTAASVTQGVSKLVVVDLVSGAVREVASHGARLYSVALDRSGKVLLTGDADGVVRVGPLAGEEPHLLYGHTGPVTGVAVSPDGRRIASGSDDGTIRLWDMPDLAAPPLHTLPHGELLAKLRSYTNLRAVRDPASDTGWKIEVGPFPGWATVPNWSP